MKRLVLLVLMLSILLIGSVMAASADHDIVRFTGGGNYPYEAEGWAWMTMNVTIDPLTDEADGWFNYRSYSEVKPKNLSGWYGEAICATPGTFMGAPAYSFVVQIIEADNGLIPGTYMKFISADGGKGGAPDWAGLTIFPPVETMPGCEWEEPFYSWPIEKGNITIHP